MYFPIEYEGAMFRPPSEAKSFLLQVTIGCSNNLCTYCDMYRAKKYRERSFEDIKAEILKVKDYFSKINQYPKRFFLCDGDALGASFDLLNKTVDELNKHFPNLERIALYATAQNMLGKTEEQLKELSQKKLNMAYLGLESGNDKVLHMIVKRNTRADMIEGSKKLIKSGFKLSIIAMLGIGGRKFSEEHVKDTASIISEISPHYFSFLTTVPIPGTPYHRMVERKMIEPLTSKELFLEMRNIIDGVNPKGNIIFRANHVSNQYPLGGELPKDKKEIVKTLHSWMVKTPEGEYPPRPASM